jgi:chromate transport protein ChrA
MQKIMKPRSKSAALESGAPEGARHPTFREAFLFWLKLGFISFGGPTGQIALMHTASMGEWLLSRRDSAIVA